MDQADTYIRSSTMEEQDQIIEEECLVISSEVKLIAKAC